MAAEDWQTLRTISEIQKTSGDIIRIEEKSFKNRSYYSFRQYYQDKNTDEFRPGKQGITFSSEEFKELLGALKGLELTESD
jgi:hypothetical protein